MPSWTLVDRRAARTTGRPSRPTAAETTIASVAGTGSLTCTGRQPEALRVVTTSPSSSREATVGGPARTHGEQGRARLPGDDLGPCDRGEQDGNQADERQLDITLILVHKPPHAETAAQGFRQRSN